MISKQRIKLALDQFLANSPNAVFDSTVLSNHLVQTLFHLELVNFGGNATTPEIAMCASEVLSAQLHDEEDEILFRRQNGSTICGEFWVGKDLECRCTNVFDTHQLADAMVSLARKRIQVT